LRATSDAPRVVLICPTGWDAAQLPRLRRSNAAPYEISTYGPDAEHAPGSFDADVFIAQAVDALQTGDVAGVTSSSDYPGCLVAAFIAAELGLPGPDPASVLRCSHKYYSRLAQRIAVPEATPRFALIDPDTVDEASLELGFPLFVKPVKSWFTQYARRIETFAELLAFVRSPAVRAHLAHFVRPFNQLLDRHGGFSVNASHMIAEELMTGHQVTLEGYVDGAGISVVGILDSIMYENTISFERFEYPSSVSDGVVHRMTMIAERILRHIGFTDALFNIELLYDDRSDAVRIVEINPRMCGQFADMMQAVNGTNTYEILFALACGEQPPPVRTGGRFEVAASFVLRHFRDGTLSCAPTAEQVRVVEERYPVTLVGSFYREGRRLSEQQYQSDGYSYRYAVVNVAGTSRHAIMRDFEAVRHKLDFRIADDAAAD
jgi:biotin carboxylase